MESISLKSQEIISTYEANLDILAEEFDKLAIDYSPEYDKYELDEVVVGAITPYVSRFAFIVTGCMLIQVFDRCEGVSLIGSRWKIPPS